MRLKITILLLVGLFCFFCDSAFAHKVNLFCYFEDTTLHGEGYFSGGRPAQDSKIEIYDLSNNELIAETSTDEKGRFSLDLDKIISVKVVMNSGQGHRTEFMLKAEENKQEIGNISDVKKTSAQSNNRVLQSEPNLVTIVGGLGWIIGIFALIYFLKKKNAF